MMILIAGTFICNYNGALTGNINNNIIRIFEQSVKRAEARIGQATACVWRECYAHQRV